MRHGAPTTQAPPDDINLGREVAPTTSSAGDSTTDDVNLGREPAPTEETTPEWSADPTVTVPTTNAVYYDTTDDVNLGREPAPTEETTPDPVADTTGTPDAPTAPEEDTSDPPADETEDVSLGRKAAPTATTSEPPVFDTCGVTDYQKDEDVTPCSNQATCNNYKPNSGNPCCLVIRCICGSDANLGADRCGNFNEFAPIGAAATVPTVSTWTTTP
jgi:hypothetical protein